jgi:hypothetical protein
MGASVDITEVGEYGLEFRPKSAALFVGTPEAAPDATAPEVEGARAALAGARIDPAGRTMSAQTTTTIGRSQTAFRSDDRLGITAGEEMSDYTYLIPTGGLQNQISLQ